MCLRMACTFSVENLKTIWRNKHLRAVLSYKTSTSIKFPSSGLSLMTVRLGVSCFILPLSQTPHLFTVSSLLLDALMLYNVAYPQIGMLIILWPCGGARIITATTATPTLMHAPPPALLWPATLCRGQ